MCYSLNTPKYWTHFSLADFHSIGKHQLDKYRLWCGIWRHTNNGPLHRIGLADNHTNRRHYKWIKRIKTQQRVQWEGIERAHSLHYSILIGCETVEFTLTFQQKQKKRFKISVESMVSHLAHRFIGGFMEIYEYTITTIFLWSLLGLASALLLFLSELVAYFTLLFR